MSFAVSDIAALETWLDEGYWADVDNLSIPIETTMTKRESVRRELERLKAGGVAERPRRRMPPLARIALFWDLGVDAYCVRCGISPGVGWRTASGFLERAHIIDRCFGGLDVEWNFGPLCSYCHRQQPIFEPGDEREALSWFGLRDEVMA